MAYPVFDLHCDTADRIGWATLDLDLRFTAGTDGYFPGDETHPQDFDLIEGNACAISLAKIGNTPWAQCFATFVPDEIPTAHAARFQAQIMAHMSGQAMLNHDRMVNVRSAADIRPALKDGKVACIHTIENATFFAEDPALIEVLKSLGVLAETSSNAEAMANAYDVTIPSVKKQIIALAVAPAIVLLGVYIPQFVQGNNELQVRKAAAAEQLAIAQDALEPVCERVAADDPYESYHDYGYRIIGYLRDNDLGAQAAYVYLSFDADGMLTDVDYTSQIDPEASLADNLARAEQDIATLCAPLNGLDISVAAPGLLTPCSLSDEFKQAFLAGSLYEEISIKTEDESIKSYYTFDTEPEEEFDEYTHPEIRLMLSAKKN